MGPVLVTGVTGLVGSGIARRLLAEGFSVMGTSRLPLRSCVPGFEALTFGSRSPYSDIAAAVERCASVVHCAAALASDGEADFFDINVRWSLELFEAAAERGRPFLLVGGSHHYDHFLPRADSGVEARRTWHYVLSKVAATATVIQRAGVLCARAAVLCVPSPYGPGAWPSTVLPGWLRTALDGGTIRVRGTGGRRQMFVFNEDIGQAAAVLLRRGAGQVPATFLVGGPRKVSMLDLAETIRDAVREEKGLEVGIAVEGRPDPTDTQDFDWEGLGIPLLPGYEPQVDLLAGLRACIQGAGLAHAYEDMAERVAR